ncbi:hypothetical protein EDD94_5588 [Streptomyces sp. PanSC9]|nr:hypothetical protein EDD94_7790 [Streptomyces sp. PanSC9]ROP55993.1 hypothetical protein EDD94_5588 [Streptomyces sp. PanSC9]
MSGKVGAPAPRDSSPWLRLRFGRLACAAGWGVLLSWGWRASLPPGRPVFPARGGRAPAPSGPAPAGGAVVPACRSGRLTLTAGDGAPACRGLPRPCCFLCSRMSAVLRLARCRPALASRPVGSLRVAAGCGVLPAPGCRAPLPRVALSSPQPAARSPDRPASSGGGSSCRSGRRGCCGRLRGSRATVRFGWPLAVQARRCRPTGVCSGACGCAAAAVAFHVVWPVVSLRVCGGLRRRGPSRTAAHSCCFLCSGVSAVLRPARCCPALARPGRCGRLVFAAGCGACPVPGCRAPLPRVPLTGFRSPHPASPQPLQSAQLACGCGGGARCSSRGVPSVVRGQGLGAVGWCPGSAAACFVSRLSIDFGCLS